MVKNAYVALKYPELLQRIADARRNGDGKRRYRSSRNNNYQ